MPHGRCTSSASRPQPSWIECEYQRLTDDDGRICNAIADDACRETPGNFARMLAANASSTVAGSVACAKNTLPWLVLQPGADARDKSTR